MTRNRCKNASMSWHPIAGSRLDARSPCQNRLRRRSLLLFLRPSQQPDKEERHQLAWSGCGASRVRQV
jgi:hypothetical protein